MSSTTTTTNLGLPQWASSDIPTWDEVSAAFLLIDTVVGAIAPKYDATATYSEGDYVQYEGGFYKAKQDISVAEAWTPAHWDAVVITTAMQDTQADLTNCVKVDMTSGTGITNTQYAHLTVIQ